MRDFCYLSLLSSFCFCFVLFCPCFVISYPFIPYLSLFCPYFPLSCPCLYLWCPCLSLFCPSMFLFLSLVLEGICDLLPNLYFCLCYRVKKRNQCVPCTIFLMQYIQAINSSLWKLNGINKSLKCRADKSIKHFDCFMFCPRSCYLAPLLCLPSLSVPALRNTSLFMTRHNVLRKNTKRKDTLSSTCLGLNFTLYKVQLHFTINPAH